MPSFSTKVARTPEEIQQCRDIRFAVFIDEQGFAADVEIDEVDETNAHVSFLVLDADADNKPVGTIRFVPNKGKLTRLAVLKDYRKYGLGKLLVEALEEHVAQGDEDVRHLVHNDAEGKPAVTVKIHSQIPVKGFYGKLGYKAEGDEFDEDGAPHVLMVKDVTVHS